MSETAPAAQPASTAPEKPAAAKKAKKPAKASAAAKKKPAGPSVSELILQAVSSSKERSGVSLAALKKALAAAGYDVEKNNSRIKLGLKGLVSKGTLVQTKGTGASGSFKLNKKAPSGEPKPNTAKVATKAKAAGAPKKQKKAPAATAKRAVKTPKKAKKPALAKKPSKSPKKPKVVRPKKVAKSPAKAKAVKPKAAKAKAGLELMFLLTQAPRLLGLQTCTIQGSSYGPIWRLYRDAGCLVLVCV
ncbi:PREDICTED: histone H1.1 isoform X2 [Chinchilla lanigera]|uniref:histone H1.1 isoform X2 n=1 Tax=Chinchilla lanigera TaxID=34839 RepID=UPI00038EFBC0|nr:PREDICTED: histone H1.1 isoform X2 [Chinchilla lanigera]